jgi:hypothetical protein
MTIKTWAVNLGLPMYVPGSAGFKSATSAQHHWSDLAYSKSLKNTAAGTLSYSSKGGSSAQAVLFWITYQASLPQYVAIQFDPSPATLDSFLKHQSAVMGYQGWLPRKIGAVIFKFAGVFRAPLFESSLQLAAIGAVIREFGLDALIAGVGTSTIVRAHRMAARVLALHDPALWNKCITQGADALVTALKEAVETVPPQRHSVLTGHFPEDELAHAT